MFFAYSFLFTIVFILMLPLFFIRRAKYLAGFSERMGNYPRFVHDGRKVVWLHCVSVGEVNAAAPLFDQLVEIFPGRRIVVSTTTKTGQDFAKKLFAEKADAVVYFPFDWKFSVRKALDLYKPSVVLLMETEIWPRFIAESKASGSKVAIVNGRLSERSANRYNFFKFFIQNVLGNVDLAVMQAERDAERIGSIGMPIERTHVSGNMKFDQSDLGDEDLTESFRKRFAFGDRPLIVAASTHQPEEEWILEAFVEFFDEASTIRPRLLIAPRHPERFESVVLTVRSTPVNRSERLSLSRRSAAASETDKKADVILLDSIGELRSVYPLADVVFVGGSLIPHGGQSILEPAAAGRAIITGPFTHNFFEAMNVFIENKAIIQLTENRPEHIVDDIFLEFSDLLEEPDQRQMLGENAAAVMKANRGATAKTIALLRHVG